MYNPVELLHKEGTNAFTMEQLHILICEGWDSCSIIPIPRIINQVVPNIVLVIESHIEAMDIVYHGCSHDNREVPPYLPYIDNGATEEGDDAGIEWVPSHIEEGSICNGHLMCIVGTSGVSRGTSISAGISGIR